MTDLLTDVSYSHYSYCNIFMSKLEITELANISVCLMTIVFSALRNT
jgi:hypothetical protein